MCKTNIFKHTATALMAVSLMAGAFSASAANIYMTPASQVSTPGSSVYVDIFASGLPDFTTGGALDISWTGDMTLDSVFWATSDSSDNGGGAFPGDWDPVSSFFTGCDSGCSSGDTSISGLYVGSFFGVIPFGDVAIARLNFTTGAGFSGSTLNMDAAALGGTWSADSGNFTNTYEGATINTVPVPAAVWLFGSGLIGLAGVARRRG